MPYKNPEDAKAWRHANRVRLKSYLYEWRKKNKDKLNAITETYRKKNPEKQRQWNLKWVQRYPWKNNCKNIFRRLKVNQQTPKWANKEAIVTFYKNCPKGYHVDHIIPLNGKNVSGLHTLENLQYLSATENLRKGNKF